MSKKRCIWTEGDEKVLLELWAERANDLRRAKRNVHIFSEISVQMAGKFSAQEVHIKIRNLTQKYRDEKKKIDNSGGRPSTWKHFDAVHQILGGAAVIKADVWESFSLDSMTSSATLSEPSPAGSQPFPSPSLSSPATSPLSSPLASTSTSVSADSSSGRKRKANHHLADMVKLMKQQSEMLKSIAEDNKALSSQIIEVIREQNVTQAELVDVMKSLVNKF